MQGLRDSCMSSTKKSACLGISKCSGLLDKKAIHGDKIAISFKSPNWASSG